MPLQNGLDIPATGKCNFSASLWYAKLNAPASLTRVGAIDTDARDDDAASGRGAVLLQHVGEGFRAGIHPREVVFSTNR